MQPTHEDLMSIGFTYKTSDNYGRYYNLDITDKLYLEYQQEANKFFLGSDDYDFDMPLRFSSIVDMETFIQSFNVPPEKYNQLLNRIVKEYFTLDFIKREDGILYPLQLEFPKEKEANVVGIIEVVLSSGEILNGIKDVETNKLYFSKSDIVLILNSLFKK